ncbi:DUF3352 domain-containing protein [Patescibacteria group bacterium]
MSTKETKEKKPKKIKEPKSPQQKENFKRRILGLLIGLIGVFLLLFVIFYTVSRVFRPIDFATMLPKDSTIGLVQINVNPRHEQIKRFYSILNKFEVYHPTSIQNILNEKFEINFEEDVEPWLNRQVGAALLEKPKADGEFDVVFFVETRDKGETKKFLESRGLQSKEDYLIADNYKGADIYRYALSQTFNFVFLNNYLIVADNDEVLKTIIDTDKTSELKLIEKPQYQKVSQNLPITTLVFTYVDIEKLIKFLKYNDQFMSEKGRELLAFEPFLRIYKAYGTTALMESNNIAVQSFTMLDDNYLEGRDFLNFDSKFRAHFLDLVPQDVKLYAGGLNLQKQFHRYSEIFNVGGEVSYLIFEGALRSIKNEYFGEEINLEEDLYPLMQSEYLIAVNGEGDDQATTIVLGLKDPLRDKDKIEVIAESFIRKSALLSPKVVEVELEDGTISKEIQTVPEEITKSQEEYKGYIIDVLNVGTQLWGVYYLILDDKLIITTKLDSMKQTIDLFINKNESFNAGPVSRESIQPVIRTSDEVMFFDLDHVLQNYKVEGFEWMDPYIEPFKYLSIGKNYFKDGISTITNITIQ